MSYEEGEAREEMYGSRKRIYELLAEVVAEFAEYEEKYPKDRKFFEISVNSEHCANVSVIPIRPPEKN